MLTQKTNFIEQNILKSIRTHSKEDQKTFSIHVLNLMSALFIKEEQNQEERIESLGHLGPRLYRTFDNLDDIFNLDYSLDSDMVIDNVTQERLYQGSGVGVQSGYSTILLTLHNIDLEEGTRIVDLGSGYGRVGLVCALLRPDIHFTGYEYVPHRVDISNKASHAFNLQEKLSFITQDLSPKNFELPEAEVYYLYDPFTEETYHFILNQIVEMSRRLKITVVTKGNANTWLQDIAQENAWPSPLIIDEGNLCVFKSS